MFTVLPTISILIALWYINIYYNRPTIFIVIAILAHYGHDLKIMTPSGFEPAIIRMKT